jgi:hypothetical protein
MALFDGLTLRYALHELPPGRLPFKRWRWELWRGARLEATGWRVSERDAARAVRRHASAVSHRLLGLPPRSHSTRDFEPFRPGARVHVRDGAVVFELVPLHLEESRELAA